MPPEGNRLTEPFKKEDLLRHIPYDFATLGSPNPSIYKIISAPLEAWIFEVVYYK